MHPKIPTKIVGESYFPLSGPGKNFNLKVKIMYFCYRKPSLRPWDMDQNFQKCVSDTSTGQKQHIFMYTSCKNQVLVPSGTPQLMLKSGPYQKIPRFIRKFKEILDLWEMNQKCKNCIPNTFLG